MTITDYCFVELQLKNKERHYSTERSKHLQLFIKTSDHFSPDYSMRTLYFLQNYKPILLFY